MTTKRIGCGARGLAVLLSAFAALAVAAAESTSGSYGTATDPANLRGPGQDGVFPAHGLSRTFSEKQNVVWKTPLPNHGQSSPVVTDRFLRTGC